MLLCPLQNTAKKRPDGSWETVRPYITQKFGGNPQMYQQFGMKGHSGIDLRAAVGVPVFAAHDGIADVIFSDTGYGLHIKIRSEHNARETVYAHLSRVSDKVSKHKFPEVSMGDLIGWTGNTGYSTAAHFHFGLRRLIPDEGGIFTWKVQDWSNGYSGWIDPIEYMITFKGTLVKSDLK